MQATLSVWIVAPSERPAGATVRLNASGSAGGKVAWWVWVEGLRDVDSLKLSF